VSSGHLVSLMNVDWRKEAGMDLPVGTARAEPAEAARVATMEKRILAFS
jgi:hypothetical protein